MRIRPGYLIEDAGNGSTNDHGKDSGTDGHGKYSENMRLID